MHARMQENAEIAAPAAKVASAWALVGVTSWADMAAFLAAIYSAILISEWCWKRFGRDLAKRWGLVK